MTVTFKWRREMEQTLQMEQLNRLQPESRIYTWLRAMDPPRTLSWLAQKVGRSRQSLATYIAGERKSRGRTVHAVTPGEVVMAVEALSLQTEAHVLRRIGGPITWKDWPHVEGE